MRQTDIQHCLRCPSELISDEDFETGICPGCWTEADDEELEAQLVEQHERNMQSAHDAYYPDAEPNWQDTRFPNEY